ncbi:MULTISPECIES: PqqD family protein [unclassified Micromonospora]|uniref:PqqD family protein n=1 Tax=unclassified Micromonospora TaxID=2617518 RepID=UPI00188DE7ED|nr:MULTISPECIES: PqqD family protein [unclassified Micromonospora]MBF5028524.1 PqqD family protein [Micromonospora sp. ANENR4]WBC03684.1 PqqD family protein [Micromonospora sp. WMMA1976]
MTRRVDVTSAVPSVRLDARLRRVGGELIVAGPDHEKAHGREPLTLSYTAEVIFRGIDGSRSLDRISDLVAADFEIPAEEIVDDVVELIDELVHAGVVEYLS